MIKNEMRKIGWPLLVIGGVFFTYLLTEFFCGGNCHPFIHGKLPPLYNGLLGFIPTVLLLLIFRKIVIMWFRHIAWWFSIFFAVVISNGTGGGFISPSREYTAFLLMALLFMITFVYALIMNKKLKNEGI